MCTEVTVDHCTRDVPRLSDAAARVAASTQQGRGTVNTQLPVETVAAVLRDALQSALSTLDGAADGTILPEQVSAHLMQWESTFDTYRHRLPDAAQHLGRSVRAALGEALGGVVLSSLDDRMIGYQLPVHGEQWNETGRRYLQDCIEWIDRWAERPGWGFVRQRLLTFDRWLITTKS